MKINILENWYILSDVNNIILCQHSGKDKQGNDVFKNKSYHSTLEQAALSFFNQNVNASDAKNLKELISDIEAIKAKVKKAFHPITEGVL